MENTTRSYTLAGHTSREYVMYVLLSVLEHFILNSIYNVPLAVRARCGGEAGCVSFRDCSTLLSVSDGRNCLAPGKSRSSPPVEEMEKSFRNRVRF